MKAFSAGILLYRLHDGEAQVLLVHPGGPYWQRKDEGAWMIPKGMVEPGETAEVAALREFREETGADIAGPLHPLCRVRQSGGKWVEAFAAEGDFDPDRLTSIRFDMEWPPRSGTMQSFPEIDQARWFTLSEARAMMLASQVPILDALDRHLAS